MPKVINVRVAAGRLIIQRATDDPKRKEGEFRRMDRTDEECKAAWRSAVQGGGPPKDGLYVVTPADGAWGLEAVSSHEEPSGPGDTGTEPTRTEEQIRADEDEESYAREDHEPSDDETDRAAVERGSQDEIADAAEAKAARESDAPGPPNPPRGDRPDVA